MASPVLIIGGPTAGGKSGLALALARARNGVVINADSLQLYQGLPILTAQPPEGDKKEIPHRLYACLSPDDACSAARWRGMALAEIGSAIGEKRLPIVVGGTGFYLKALIEGLSPIPDVPPEFRDRAIRRQKELGNPAFHAALKDSDPQTAALLDPLNTQRVIRAWEVLEATGKGLAEWQKIPPAPPPAHLRFISVMLVPPRDQLYKNCNDRFSKMLVNGALAEAQAFRAARITPSPLENALGYREICEHLDGKISREDALKSACQSTRHYAKRQTTWFRHQLKADLSLTEMTAEKILALI